MIDQKKAVGHLSLLSVDITEPMKMTVSLEPKEFMLMIGANGSGKTFILALTWAMSYIINSVVKTTSMGMSSVVSTEFAQFVLDHCFSDQNINGTLKATYTSEAELEIVVEKGKVISLKHSGLEEVTGITNTVFLSSQMRTFDAISLYLKVRRTVESKELMRSFKLYDIAYLESLISKMPCDVPEDIKTVLKDSYDVKENIKSFGVDLGKDDFYILSEDGTRKYMTTYGNGHQSIINMIVAHL